MRHGKSKTLKKTIKASSGSSGPQGLIYRPSGRISRVSQRTAFFFSIYFQKINQHCTTKNYLTWALRRIYVKLSRSLERWTPALFEMSKNKRECNYRTISSRVQSLHCGVSSYVSIIGCPDKSDNSFPLILFKGFLVKVQASSACLCRGVGYV